MRFKLLSVILSSLILGACVSSTENNGVVVSKPVVVESTRNFKWDTKESFALNVSRMGNPADLGLGLVDVNDPASYEIDRDSNSMFSFASGFFAGGILGGLGALSMDSEIEKNRSWSPYFVGFIDESKIDLTSPSSGTQMGNILNDVFTNVSPNSLQNSAYLGAYPLKIYTKDTMTMLVFRGAICKKAAEFNKKPNVEATNEWDYITSESIFAGDFSSLPNNACSLTLTTKVTGNYNGKLIVTHEILNTSTDVYLASTLANELNTPLVFPDIYKYKSSNDGKIYYHKLGTPKVFYNGKMYLFDRAEISKPIL
jgi:hypothetical protein